MTISLHFQVIWLLATFVQAGVCVLILRERLLRIWPSLFALMADEVLASIILQVVHRSYAAYFYVYWWNVVLLSAFRIWLAWDIFRSMPANKLFPAYLRKWVVGFSAVAGACTWWALNTPFTGLPMLTVAAIVNRAVTFTWTAVFLSALCTIFISGFAFDLTTIRIITGELIRLLSLSAVAAAFGWTNHHTYRTSLAELDSAVGGAVAAYFCFALARYHREAEREALEYQQMFPPSHLP